MKEKIEQLLNKLHDVENLLGQPDILSNQERYKKLTQEYSHLTNLKKTWEKYNQLSQALHENQELLRLEQEEEMISIIQDEISSLEKQTKTLSSRLHSLIVPPDPRDSRNIIMELRAGTGGDEAALFVKDCIRMYRNYADHMGWKYEVLSSAEAEVGGYREYVMGISGKDVFRNFQFEAGTHRVQRVPQTETQGRVHTSAITIAILLEPDEREVSIEEKDLRIETYRASGAGGQHVNTTDSAVRIIHIPTNTVVCCQDERSQIKNKERALRLLKAKVAEQKQKEQQKEISSLRATQIGSGDRSERIRTYNFPQNRLTDHRINLTLYSLDKIMEGELQQVLDELVGFYYQKKISNS